MNQDGIRLCLMSPFQYLLNTRHQYLRMIGLNDNRDIRLLSDFTAYGITVLTWQVDIQQHKVCLRFQDMICDMQKIRAALTGITVSLQQDRQFPADFCFIFNNEYFHFGSSFRFLFCPHGTALNTQNNALWQAIAERYGAIRSRIDALPRTLTYNDFYWTNLIVSIDRERAFMFDYNLLGK